MLFSRLKQVYTQVLLLTGAAGHVTSRILCSTSESEPQLVTMGCQSVRDFVGGQNIFLIQGLFSALGCWDVVCFVRHKILSPVSQRCDRSVCMMFER